MSLAWKIRLTSVPARILYYVLVGLVTPLLLRWNWPVTDQSAWWRDLVPIALNMVIIMVLSLALQFLHEDLRSNPERRYSQVTEDSL